MSEHDDLLLGSASLVDAIDHLLNKGVVLVGETTLSVAGVDLVYLGLNIILSSVETMQSTAGRAQPAPAVEAPLQLPAVSPWTAAPSGEPELRPVSQGSYSGERHPPPSASPPGDVPVSPPPAGIADHIPVPADERPERGLARLVLALVELLRQLMERQAVRRMEGQSLTDEQVERMGAALMALEEKMAELREAFGLSAEDINLDLGPLGRLLR